MTDLDVAVCDRARVSRDARFDGRFFTGVRTTGIYCRPICPVKPARSQNVVFFPTAAAAERAGFRPCLRCRPEAAPGSPAWRGTAAVVSRALALINRGVLDEGSVDDLAAAVGVGARHLTRLFMKHVGAPPTAAARTRRLQLAKTLLDETTLPIAQVAFAAGFASIRRFNASFAGTFDRPPSAMRRGRPALRDDGDAITIRLAYRPPLDWQAAVDLLSAESTPGVEEITTDCYRRTISLDGRVGWMRVRPASSADRLELTAWLPDYAGLRALIERVRVIFDLGADPARIARQLAADPSLAPLLARTFGVRLPGTWDGFEVAVRRVIARDVGTSRASDIMAWLASTHGRVLQPRPERGPAIVFPEPSAIAVMSGTGRGLSSATVRALRRLGRATAAGSIRFDSGVDAETLVEQLRAVVGFDAPTAHWIVLRSLAEPDAAPFGAEPNRDGRHSRRTLFAKAERWRPWRSYVAILRLRAPAAMNRVPTSAESKISNRR